MVTKCPVLYVIADYPYLGDFARWTAVLRALDQVAVDGMAIQVRAHDVEVDEFREIAVRGRAAIRLA